MEQVSLSLTLLLVLAPCFGCHWCFENAIDVHMIILKIGTDWLKRRQRTVLVMDPSGPQGMTVICANRAVYGTECPHSLSLGLPTVC